MSGPEPEIRAVVIPLRPPPFLTPTVVLLLSSAVTVSAVTAVASALLASRGQTLPLQTWAILAGSLLVTAAFCVAWQRLRPRAVPPLAILPDRIVLPRGSASKRPIQIPLHRLFGVQREGRGFTERVLIGVEGRLPRSLLVSSFGSPEGPAALDAELRRAVRALPAGEQRIALLDRTRAAAEARRRGFPWLTLTCVAVLLAVFAAELRMGAVGNVGRLLGLGANLGELVRAGDLHRLVTANLLHASWQHLAMNALGIAVCGQLLERLIGRARFGVVLLAGALAGAAASAYLGQESVSVGASTGVYGLVAAFLFLGLRFKRELPPSLRFPGWYWASLIAVSALVELQLPGVDHVAHAGGAAGGLLAMALITHGRSLLELRRSGAGVVAAAVVLAGVFAAGASEGARRLGTGSAGTVQLAATLMQRPQLELSRANDLAWIVAAHELATREQLVGARDRLAELAGGAPGAPELDTLATLAYRLGDPERASELQRQALARDPSGFFASQLARFEWAALERRERSAEPGDVAGLEPRFVDRGRDSSVGVELARAPDRATEIFAVAVADGDLVASLRLLVGPGEAGPFELRSEKPLGLRSEKPLGLRSEKPLHEAFEWRATWIRPAALAPEDLAETGSAGWVWPMDPAVAALP